ncbi:zinc metalloprotease HtpX [Methanotorris formicicus]|uniref:Protease HtpX homolog n=1 Tax=Methanotorris formicicus Mc-S-70 TaxID=647171 RepID=H1L1L6_9EURY|nr:zinc metalloprotease HtpX [Methanotorris formicicus]EHP83622.1 peptidase M48 Ste24p [Methanotorris formicicus Mc-S-70]
MFLENVKTVILLAILTGLLYGICYLLHIPPVIAIILALIPNLIAYLYCDKFVLWGYNARIIDEHELPQLHRMVEKIAIKAGIPKPRIAIIETPTPNAFATGRDPKNAVVAVTTGILNLLSPEELEGVIAHEIGHILHRDILISSLVATLAGAIMYIADWLHLSLLFGFEREEEENPLSLVATLAFLVLAPIAATIIQLAISRQREFYADEEGGKLSNPIYLANALAKLENGVSVYPMERGSPSTAHMFIVNPFKGEVIAKLFSTHPPTEERIKRLLELARRMGIHTAIKY